MSATSIGLPKLKIAFEKAAQATANRAKKGYVGMIVRDAKAQGLHKLVSDTMIPTELGVDNQALVKLAFEGSDRGAPSLVYLVVIATGTEDTTALEAGLKSIEGLTLDYLAGPPDATAAELTALEKSIGAQIARLLYGEDMTAGETDAVLTGTWKMQVDLTPNLLDALNDALGLDLQMDDPTVMTMLVTFGEDGSYHMDYDAKALREELNALEDALCEKYPDQEALLKQAFAGLQLDVDGSSGTYTASNGILYLTQSGEDWEDILYYSVEDNKLYLTPPQDEESGDWGGMFGSEYPMVFERVD